MATYSYNSFSPGTMSIATDTEKSLQVGIKSLQDSILSLNSLTGRVNGCFGWYWGRIQEGKKFFVFGFRFLPIWITDFVDEFNQAFKNIKIEVLCLKPLYIELGTPGVQRTVTDEIPESGANACSMLFRFRFCKEYPDKAIKFAEYTLHHFVRQLSFQEFSWNSARYLIDTKFPKTVEFPHLHASIFRSNNEKEKYRALAEKKITLNNVLNFDSIERANKAIERYTKYSTGIRQTECLAIFTKRQTFCLDRSLDHDKIISTINLFGSSDYTPREYSITFNGMYHRYNSETGILEHGGYCYVKSEKTGTINAASYSMLDSAIKNAKIYEKRKAKNAKKLEGGK
jgi:hypothetical protein